MSDDDTVVVLFRKSFLLPALCFFPAFMAMSIWLLITPLPDWSVPEWVVRTIAGVGVLVFAAYSTFIGCLMRAVPFRADRDGISTERWLDWHAYGQIRWQDTKGPRVVAVGPWRLIFIRWRDRRPYLDRGNLLQRGLKALSIPVFAVLMGNVSCAGNFDEIMPRLRRFFDQATDRV